MLREIRFEALSQRASRAFGRGALVSLGLAALVVAVAPGTLAASEAATNPLPDECQNPNLSAAEQALLSMPAYSLVLPAMVTLRIDPGFSAPGGQTRIHCSHRSHSTGPRYRESGLRTALVSTLTKRLCAPNWGVMKRL